MSVHRLPSSQSWERTTKFTSLLRDVFAEQWKFSRIVARLEALSLVDARWKDAGIFRSRNNGHFYAQRNKGRDGPWTSQCPGPGDAWHRSRLARSDRNSAPGERCHGWPIRSDRMETLLQPTLPSPSITFPSARRDSSRQFCALSFRCRFRRFYSSRSSLAPANLGY